MRYSYECPCGAQQDWSGSPGEQPGGLACDCGREALQLLCFNFLAKKTPPKLPSDKELCRALMERSNARLRAKEHKIRARDREIVETARNRVHAENRRPKIHPSADAVQVAEIPARVAREHEMINGQGSWAELMQDKPALKKKLKDQNLWLQQ
jgi:hypothetical protein